MAEHRLVYYIGQGQDHIVDMKHYFYLSFLLQIIGVKYLRVEYFMIILNLQPER